MINGQKFILEGLEVADTRKRTNAPNIQHIKPNPKPHIIT